MIISILNSVIFPIELLLASYICAVKINKRSYWGFAWFSHCFLHAYLWQL